MKEKIEKKWEELKKEITTIENELRGLDQRKGELMRSLIENTGSLKTLEKLLKEENGEEKNV